MSRDNPRKRSTCDASMPYASSTFSALSFSPSSNSAASLSASLGFGPGRTRPPSRRLRQLCNAFSTASVSTSARSDVSATDCSTAHFSFSDSISSAMTSNNDNVDVLEPSVAVLGTMLLATLYSCCLTRLRSTSAMASFIAAVVESANRMHSPFLLRAALPIICINDLALRMKPGISASRIATRDTDGKSRPSRSSCAPTIQSSSPFWSLDSFTARCGAVNSECTQSARTP
mmetsp:Transcript_4445/g.14541  ORF Transcript_4445/g.14541 Transcript_4445/m.14541 type:complete len:231 (+) Transcript_4445:1390-2082(+)